MDIISQALITVRNSQALSFEWEGYGFKLYVPDDALPSGVNECVILIQVSLSGQFNLPQEHSLVSAVYRITTPLQLTKPVMIEIEHCAICNSSDDYEALTFAVAETVTKEFPYRFEVLPGGVFTLQSPYGSINVQHFTLFAIFARLRSHRRYCAQLLYICKQPADWRLHFVITKDLEMETRKVAEAYSERKIDAMKFEIQFDRDVAEIQLDIPRTGKVTKEGWKIVAPHYPRITKNQVDRFQPSTTRTSTSIPSCVLHILWVNDHQSPPVLDYCEIKLLGAKPPNNYFLLSLNPEFSKQLLSYQPESGAGIADTPTIPCLRDLMASLCSRVASKWKLLGVYLRIPKAALDTIKHENQEDCLMEVLDRWLKQADPSQASWATIVEAIELLEDKKLAGELRSKYCLPTS